jgi:hypothetical protein
MPEVLPRTELKSVAMALSHIVMHFALCNAAARLGPQAELPVHITVTDRINRDVIDQDAKVIRYEGNTSTAQFDIPWGIYRAAVQMKAGRATCSAVQYFAVLIDHDRSLTVQLQDPHTPPQPVPTLIMGTAAFAFSYVQPTVMVFGPDTKCNGPVGTPLNAGIDQTNDSDAFYASVYPDEVLVRKNAVVVALRMTDTQGGYHYLHVPTNFLGWSVRWPSSGQMNVNENVIDYVADKPEDTLLCPRMYETETH